MCIVVNGFGIIADNILFLSRKCQADSGHTQDLI